MKLQNRVFAFFKNIANLKILIIGFMFLLSCSNPAITEESINQEMSKNKKEIAELNAKNHELKGQLKEIKGADNQEHIQKVVSKTVVSEKFEHFFEASGSVEAVKQAFISPEINGQINKIYVVEGQKVKKGQSLAKLNTSVTDNTIKEIESSLELASLLYKKQKQLWDKKIGSEIDFLNAKNNKISLENKLSTLRAQKNMALITSPINGTIEMISLKEGELAVPGMQFMLIVNLESVYINADISEAYISKIKEGDSVLLKISAYPEMTIYTDIYRIGNVISTQNRTFKTQLLIKNKNNLLKPNLTTVLKLNDYENNNALVVPSIILKQDMKGTYLYVAEKTNNGSFAKKVYVEPGMSENDNTIISKGLSEGNKVIVKGYNLIADGDKVNPSN
ncbi:MAG: efflux RND transporter periplasmic adaptor subunit [Bacteroidetes bacterium]|jgi:membrane fusion protein, multidrug efflux system|nr:efflux RND transporter periplasmic adaptor subunit [Bacteroidota bacterium]MBT6687959.1 efflux RND transporter periplasmic adaptor subunit [Bacteroidota bacterium]MBT7143298.1 efflux RND transporter periplasmic adaptor subunit [Bacteroidota bacterium]MBT7490279.1 efflux RND transporter periplasmic adaptor subunit [Bacteroidota bacterium]